MTSARSSVPPFHAMEMAGLATAREATGASVIHLEVGQPWSPAPAAVLAAAAAGARARPDRVHERQRPARRCAGGSPGTTRLVRRRASTRPPSSSPPARRPAFTLAFLACFDPGDRVGVVEPGYPCYRNTLLALGRRARRHRRRARAPAGRRRPSCSTAAGPLDGLVVASPSNPTGTVLARERLAEVVDWCRGPRRPADLRRDLPRHHLRPAGRERARARSSDAVVVNSFSKYFSMTGWRLGWIVAPPAVLEAVERFQQNLYICAPTLSQLAARRRLRLRGGARRPRRPLRRRTAGCCSTAWPPPA